MRITKMIKEKLQKHLIYGLFFGILVFATCFPANTGSAMGLANANSSINILKFDYTTITPSFHTNLNLPWKSVLQCMVIDGKTGDIYASQVSNSTEGKSESFGISRFNKSGQLLDYMEVRYGGHGSTIGLERENGVLYIWSNFNESNPDGSFAGYKLARYPYVAGKIMTLSDPSVQVFDKFNNKYTLPILDSTNGFIAFLVRNSSQNQVVELRRLADVKNGVNKVMGVPVQLPSDLSYGQGASIDGYDFYWRTGDTNAKTYPDEISYFSFIDGKLKSRKSYTFGSASDGKFEGNFREPESVFLYKDPWTGKKSLYAGVVTGSSGKRINKIYVFPQKSAADALRDTFLKK